MEMDKRVRETVTLSLDDYRDIQEEIATENFKRGLARGENNLMFYLHQISLGNLGADALDMNSIDPNFRPILLDILNKLIKGNVC